MALAEPVRIPFGNASFSFVDIPIQGFVYRFRYRYNARFDYWSLAIYNTQDVPLIESAKIVLNYNIIGQYVDRGLPKGKIIATRVSGTSQKITRDELLSGEVLLSFFEEIDNE